METTQFFSIREDTEIWLNGMNIQNYTIHDNLTVDVNGDVNLGGKNLKYFPVQFGQVKGHFWCSDNNLKTLKGCPNEVKGAFDCSSNNLTSLEHSPYLVGKDFYCSNNQLVTLEGAAHYVGGSFWCRVNHLTSLEHAPQIIKKNIYFHKNPIVDFSYLDFDIRGNFYFTATTKIDYLDNYKDKFGVISINFNEFKKLQALKKLNEKLLDKLPASNQKLSKNKI